MSGKVNLDALIPREDFEVQDDESLQFQAKEAIEIRDLESESLFYLVLRKPDFQRETSDWSPEKIVDFVQSYLAGDLIPAIILWKSPDNHIFVIDGAHRLSALIAWVQDDYGAGSLSRLFFEHVMPEDQTKEADTTHRQIQQKIGTYKDYKLALQNPSKWKQEIVEKARRLASLAIQVQWVRGNADKAEASFMKINQQAAPINKTEFRLIQARKQPNALAARAIIRSGTGHKYWSKFRGDKQQEIQDIAKEIHDILFTPPLRTPIKTSDLPVAGKVYSPQTLQLVFDFVNLANDIRSDSYLKDDSDGQETIQFLKNTRKIARRISGMHASSLGLHPAVYFYSVSGRYQQTSFLAIVELIKEFERKNYYRIFTEHRRDFEEFFIKHKEFAIQAATLVGSGTKKGMKPLQLLYQMVLDSLVEKKTEKEILDSLYADKRFSTFLKWSPSEGFEYGRDFDSEVKSQVYLREALKNLIRCQICQGFVHVQSITIDHVERREDGGNGSPENAQLTHPYCNTTFKN